MRKAIPTLLFTLAALASFSVWAFGSGLYQSEVGLYTLCAVVFLVFGGLALIPGQGLTNGKARAAFISRYVLGFTSYAVLWSVAWFAFQNTFGEVSGSFFGYLALVSILRPAMVREGQGVLNTTAILFLWGILGYYAGELAYASLQNRGALAVDLHLDPQQESTLAKLAWGLFYGLGLGYGLASITQPRR